MIEASKQWRAATCKWCGREVRFHGIQSHWKNHCTEVPPLPDGQRRCSLCQEAKPTDRFPSRINLQNGGQPRTCVECRSTQLQEWRSRIGGAQRTRNTSETAARGRKRRALRFYHGIDISVYDDLLRAQDGKCAICHKPPTGMNHRTNTLHVDHDHATGKVRGLLCHFCNVGIGHFNEDPILMLAAMYYLAHHSGVPAVS